MNTLKAGTVLHGKLDYHIISQLGHGGFGITYLSEATYKINNIPQKGKFCIKEFFLSDKCSRAESGFVNFNSDEKTVKDGKSDFKKEAKTLMDLNDAGIVPVSEIIEANNTVYYVMQFLEGETLDKKIHSEKRLTEKDALPIIAKVGKALSMLHSKKMLHLDVKPENIMLVNDGGEVRPVLIDFGLSRSYNMFGRESSVKKVFAISEGYSPVEQYGILDSFSPESDVYALASTLFHMLTGHQPKASNVVTTSDLFKELDRHDVSDNTINAIICAMHKEMRHRTESVDKFMADLGLNAKVGGNKQPKDEGEDSQTKGINAPPSKPPKKRHYIVGAVAALTLLMALLYTTSLIGGLKKIRQTFTANGVSFTMVRVEGGTFMMGATKEQGSDAYDYEKPAHKVTLSTYSIGETEVTQELWEAVMGSNPSYFKGAKRPVEKVSWDDCQEFVKKLNSATGQSFRLPTEAEWEYAARGGSHSKGYKYSGSNDIESVAWYYMNSAAKGESSPDYGTHIVATKQPNELGLYDMSGNVWEWCSDRYGSYSSSTQRNPTGPESGSYRVGRGGSWRNGAGRCRSSIRDYNAPGDRNRFLGLRLVLSE